jgi:hypothetical protein
MAPFFGFKGKPKTPEELVARVKCSVQTLSSSSKDKEVEKAGCVLLTAPAQDKCPLSVPFEIPRSLADCTWLDPCLMNAQGQSADLRRGWRKTCRKDATEYISMLAQCFPKGSAEPGSDLDATMAALLSPDETLVLLVDNLAKLQFETRKAVVEIFQSVCKYQHPVTKEYPGLVYVRHRPYLIRTLVLGYDEPSIALNCGEMARFAISRDPQIANAILKSETLFKFFEHVQVQLFKNR